MLTCSEYLTSTTSLNLHRKPQKVTNIIIPILQARRLSRIVTYVSQGQLQWIRKNLEKQLGSQPHFS